MTKAEEAAAEKRRKPKNPPCLNCTADGYKPNFITSSFILNPGNVDYRLADIITPYMYKIGIDTPNKVTMLNCVAVRALSVYLMMGGSVFGYWAQLILLPMHQVLDCADGQMARRYGLGSEFGEWLDHTTDNVYGLFFMLSMGYRLYLAYPEEGVTSGPMLLFAVIILTMAFFGNIGIQAKVAGVHYDKMTTLQKVGMHQELYMTYIYIAMMSLFITTGMLK